jgi:hypothetical protein
LEVIDHDGYIRLRPISGMAKAALENAILYMIRSYKESGLLTQGEIEEVLDNVRRRLVRQV